MALLRKFKILRASLDATGGSTVGRAHSNTDVGSLIDAYHERLAIVSCESDGTDVNSHKIACQEVGLDIDSLARLRMVHWRRQLLTTSNAKGQLLAALVEACLAQLGSHWVYEAARVGWSDQELFGLDRQHPLARTEAMGLLVHLSANGLGGPFEDVEITASSATFSTLAGCTLVHQRFSGTYGPPIWEHPVLTSQP